MWSCAGIAPEGTINNPKEGAKNLCEITHLLRKTLSYRKREDIKVGKW
jgi:hypothetical protein